MDGSFYQQLGVESGASTGQVRAAYGRAVASLVKRRKAVVEGGGDPLPLDRQRARLDEAWQVLSDPVRRRRYDAMGAWLDDPGDPANIKAFWERVSPSLVHPAAAAAVRLLRATTHLKEMEPVQLSASAAEDEPPTLVPDDEDRTAARVARLGPGTDADEPAARGGSVVPLPRPTPSAPPGPSLKVVDGSPEANPVIVLPTTAPRHRTLSTEDVARLADKHGYSGALLRAVREARGIELAEMADTTRISAKYLTAIEADDHGSLPSATFVRGYVREMARMLKLDDQALVDGYMRRLN